MEARDFDLVIVGAGASGLIAGIFAAGYGISVAILEHKETAGKKLALTGNGKCNLSNLNVAPACYRGQQEGFTCYALQRFGIMETREFFRTIGIPWKTKNGGFYPYCEEAKNVRDVLVNEAEARGISIFYEIGIQKITSGGGVFSFTTKQGTFTGRAMILATGGSSYKETGSDGSGLLYLKDLGDHPVIPPFPALVSLKAAGDYFREIAGVRVISGLRLLIDGEEAASDTGEVQFTDYGISGIPTFQVSRFAAAALREGKTVEAVCDFLPGIDQSSAEEFLKDVLSMHPGQLSLLLSGCMHKKLIPVIMERAAVKDQQGTGVSAEEQQRLLRAMKEFRITITDTGKPDTAQCTAGGIDTAYVDGMTMESKRISGLFFCGEVLDVDGICGGFNLQWAWSSGALAGYSAAQRIIKS